MGAPATADDSYLTGCIDRHDETVGDRGTRRGPVDGRCRAGAVTTFVHGKVTAANCAGGREVHEDGGSSGARCRR